MMTGNQKQEAQGGKQQSAADRTEFAAERTVLANERTYAAWMRTGLTALVSGLAALRFMKEALANWAVLAVAMALFVFAAFSFGAGGMALRAHGAQPSGIENRADQGLAGCHGDAVAAGLLADRRG